MSSTQRERERTEKRGDDIKWAGHALNSYTCCLHFSQINMAPRFRKCSLTLPSAKSHSSPSFLSNPVFTFPPRFGLYIPAGAPKYLFFAHKCAFRAAGLWITAAYKNKLDKRKTNITTGKKTHLNITLENNTKWYTLFMNNDMF